MLFFLLTLLPSVLWHCWMGDRKGIRPVKTEWWGAGVVICLERGADLHVAQLMSLPLTVSCFSKIRIGFTFLVPAHLGSPGKRAVKWVCVYCLFASGCWPVFCHAIINKYWLIDWVLTVLLIFICCCPVCSATYSSTTRDRLPRSWKHSWRRTRFGRRQDLSHRQPYQLCLIATH